MSIIEAIGNTPMVEVKRIWSSDETGVRILAKLEGSNPGGSVKDRPAYYMLKEAIDSGELSNGKVILEPTSGNTGVGLAIVAAQRGYKCVFVMTNKAGKEKVDLLRA